MLGATAVRVHPKLVVALAFASGLAVASQAQWIAPKITPAVLAVLGPLVVAYPFWGLCGFVFLIPIEEAFIVAENVTLLKLFGPLVFLGWASQLLCQRRGRFARPQSSVVGLIGYSVWGLASVLWSHYPDAALERSLTTLLLAAFLFLVTQLVEDGTNLRLLVASYVAGTVLSGVFGLHNFLTVGLTDLRRVSAVVPAQGAAYIQNPGHYGIILAPGIFYFLVSFLFGKRSLQKLVSFVGFLGLLLAALASGTRSFVVTFAVSSVTLLCYLWHRGLWGRAMSLAAWVVVVAVALASVLPSFLADRYVTIVTSMADRGSGRLDIWKVVLVQIIENPIIGVGAANGPLRYDEYRVHATDQYGLTLIDPQAWSGGRDQHNIYLQNWAEFGIIGFGLFAASLIIMAVKMYRALRSHPPPSADWQLGLVIGLNFLALLATGISEPIQVRKYLWLGMALVVAYSRQRSVQLKRGSLRDAADTSDTMI